MERSQAFKGAGRSGTLLRFLVERTLHGRAGELKEYTLGAEALGRGNTFDPRIDSIARVEASRLRNRLDLYYASEGRADQIRICLPKGSYVPTFEAAAGTVRDGARVWKAMVAGAGAVALAALWFSMREPKAGTTLPTRLEVDLGPGVAMRSAHVGSSSVIVSPDGRRLVFVSFRNKVQRLMTMVLDQVGGSESTELPGTEGARSPFFSPDGRWVAYLAAGKLWKTPAEGGTPVPLCDAQDLLGGSWGDDDWIVAALDPSGLWRVPSAGGKPSRLEGPASNAGARWPQVLPGSKAVLLSAGSPGEGPPRISVLSLSDGKLKDLVQGGAYGRYLPSGHLAYVDRGSLLVARFDPQRLELTGKPVMILNDVTVNMYGSAEFDVSQTGVMVCRRRTGGAKSVIHWLDSSGANAPLVPEPGEYMLPRVSPDGRHLSFLVGQIEQREAVELRIVAVPSGKLVKSVVGAAYSSPVWSPDGRFLVTPRPGGGMNWLSIKGSAPPQTLLRSTDVQIPWSFHPGGRLAFHQRGLGPGGPVTFDLWTVAVALDSDSPVAGLPQPFLISNAFEVYPAFSPDGRWMTYTSLQSGAHEVYVRTFPDTGRQWQVSDGGGLFGSWSREGRRLYYRTREQRIMVVDWNATDGEFRTGRPRPFTDLTLADTGVAPNFDVAPNAKIAALVPVSQAAAQQDDRHVTVVMNFLDEVRRRAP